MSAQISNDAAVAIRVPGVRTFHSTPLIPMDCTGALGTGLGKTMMSGTAEDGVEEGEFHHIKSTWHMDSRGMSLQD